MRCDSCTITNIVSGIRTYVLNTPILEIGYEGILRGGWKLSS